MKNKLLIIALSLVTVLGIAHVPTYAAGKSEAAMGAKPGTATIEYIVVGSESFEVLEAAIAHAGLLGVLDGKKQYTVFAPTDEAFRSFTNKSSNAEAIETIESLEPEAVANILLYHVTNGRRISTSVLAAPSYKMVNGDRLTRAELAEAGIAATDTSASNGVIHVINSVLMPSE